MLRQRLIFGMVVVGLIVALLLLDGKLAGSDEAGAAASLAERVLRNGLLCALVVAAISVLVVRELLGFARARGLQPFASLAVILAGALVASPIVVFHCPAAGSGWDAWIVAAAVVIAFVLHGLRGTHANALGNIAATLFIALYAGGLASFLLRLRIEIGGSAGVTLLGLTVLAVKANDIGAYFTGRAFGRHKLIEWLSPKKTWEGFVGGVLTSIVGTVGVGTWLRVGGLIPLAPDWTGYALLGGFGLLMALLSVAGDLSASLLKRDAGLKDSGTGLPGLGGIIDMVDSPLLAAPFAWLFWTRLL